MIDRHLKKELKLFYSAPAPLRKRAFLRRFPQRGISCQKFILQQAGYIRKWVWLISFAAFALGMAGSILLDKRLLWICSAMMPVAALSAMTENTRSALHRMEELEMACRFSLKSVLMARMGIVGVLHLLFLGAAVPLIWKADLFAFLRTGVYLFMPYLLTTFLCLAVTRRVRGGESLYACMGIAVLVSGVYFYLQYTAAFLFHAKYFQWQLAALLLLVFATAREYRKKLYQTEELTWNLSQTD